VAVRQAGRQPLRLARLDEAIKQMGRYSL
jgi:hypothetical protein